MLNLELGVPMDFPENTISTKSNLTLELNNRKERSSA
jgi:hypothetical protein